MNNKPVAYRHWMIDEEFPEDSCWEYFDAPTGEDCKECQPLYSEAFVRHQQAEIEALKESLQYKDKYIDMLIMDGEND